MRKIEIELREANERIAELEAALREIATLATYPNTLREIIDTAHKALSQ